MTSEAAEKEAHYSIGEASAFSGLSTHTVRVWERRYGKPDAVRLPSGHRRYTEEHVQWLRTVSELLSYGHRPGQLMELGDAALHRLLEEERGESERDPEFARKLDALVSGRPEDLRGELEHSFHEVGIRRTVHELVGPLVQHVGESWSDGSIDVRHEHAISEVVQDTLRIIRRNLMSQDLVRRQGGPHVLLATLPGEHHGLGLQIIALLFALSGLEPLILGVDLPVEELAEAAREHPRAAVGVSVSLATGGPDTDRVIAQLLRMLPQDRPLLVGGAGARGARRGVRGVTYLDRLEDFEDWIRKRSSSAA